MSDENQPVAPAPDSPQPDNAVPPADTGVPATPSAADASAETDAATEGEGDESKPKPRGGFQKRIHELTAKIKERERQLAEFTAPKAADGDADAPPKRETFASYEDYIRAEAAHTARQEFSKLQRESVQQATATARDDRVMKLRAELSADAAEDPAFNKAWSTVTTKGFPISDTMGDAIAESDNPHAIIEWLAANRAEAERLHDDPDRGRVFRTLTLIEARAASAPPARTPQAPPPPPTVGGRSAPRVNMDKIAASEDASEYIRLRRQQMAGA